MGKNYRDLDAIYGEVTEIAKMLQGLIKSVKTNNL